MGFFSKLFGRGNGNDSPRVDGVLSVVELAQRYAAALRAAYPEASVEVVPADSPAETRVVWEMPGDISGSMFLGNLYSRYTSAPAQLDALIAEQLAAYTQAHAQMVADTQSEGMILPVIKTRAWYEAASRQLKAAGVPDEQMPFIVEGLAGDLVVTYVEDTPQAMGFLAPATLQQRGIERQQLHALALGNLSAMLPELDVAGNAGRYAVRLDRNYDASMALLLADWRDRLDIAGEPVLAIAARDELMVCGSEDAESIAALRDIAASIAADSPYSLSQELYVHRDGELQLLK